MCLHAGYNPIGDENVYGLGQGAPRGVPLHRSAPFQVRKRFFTLLGRNYGKKRKKTPSIPTIRSRSPDALHFGMFFLLLFFRLKITPTSSSSPIFVDRLFNKQFKNTEHAANLFALKELGTSDCSFPIFSTV